MKVSKMASRPKPVEVYKWSLMSNFAKGEEWSKLVLWENETLRRKVVVEMTVGELRRLCGCAESYLSDLARRGQ